MDFDDLREAARSPVRVDSEDSSSPIWTDDIEMQVKRGEARRKELAQDDEDDLVYEGETRDSDREIELCLEERGKIVSIEGIPTEGLRHAYQLNRQCVKENPIRIEGNGFIARAHIPIEEPELYWCEGKDDAGSVRCRLLIRKRHHDFVANVHDEDDTEDEVARLLWERFKGNDDIIRHADFKRLTTAALSVGGNLRTLVGGWRAGILAKCLSVPDEDLFAYILHRHLVFRVCYGGVGLARHSTWHSRSALVGVSLLWSLSANCLISAIVIPHASRITQVVVITVADSVGCSVLSASFYVANARCIERLCDACQATCSLNLPAILTTAFAFIILILLLVSLTPDELYLAVYSFLPIWCTARFTEIFEKGTAWAFLVQYGAFPTLDQDSTPAKDMSLHPTSSTRRRLFFGHLSQTFQHTWTSSFSNHASSSGSVQYQDDKVVPLPRPSSTDKLLLASIHTTTSVSAPEVSQHGSFNSTPEPLCPSSAHVSSPAPLNGSLSRHQHSTTNGHDTTNHHHNDDNDDLVHSHEQQNDDDDDSSRLPPLSSRQNLV